MAKNLGHFPADLYYKNPLKQRLHVKNFHNRIYDTFVIRLEIKDYLKHKLTIFDG